MSEKKKPVVRFAGFTNDWEQRKLGEIATFINGRAYSQDELLDSGKYKVLRVGNFYTNDAWYYSDLELGEKYYADYGDLLYTWSATFGPHIWLGDRVIYHYHIWKVELSDALDKQFMVQLLEQDKANIISTHNGSTMVHVTKSDMEQKMISIPSVPEQKKIGGYLTVLDSLITLHQRKCDKLKNVKKSMLEKMFPKNGCRVPEIRFAGFTDDWEQRKLGDVGYTYTGLSGKTKNDFGHGKAKFVTYMNVFSNPVTNIEMLEDVEIDNGQNEVQAGDVFFTTSSETLDEVGMSSVMLENKPNIYLNSFCFGYRPTEKIDNYYFAYMLRSGSVRKSITFLAQGISRYNISKNKVMEIEIPLPKTDEQQAIGAYFKHLDNLITLHQRKLEKLQNIKKSCLEKMFV